MTLSPPAPFRFLLIFVAVFPPWAQAQITPKPDGVMRSLFGLSASASSGNTESSTATVTGEAVRQTEDSKWGLTGRANYAKGDTGTTASNVALGTQYDRNFNDVPWFGFGKLDLLRDRPANIDSRASVYGGVGRHLVRNDDNTWDVIGGLGYTKDRYVEATDVAGESRTRYGRTEIVLSEISSHKLTPTTSVRQKFELYSDLGPQGGYRTVLDTGLAVAITDHLQLTTGVLHRYASDPGVGVKHNDALFVTGISVRFE